jgi:pyruvate/2-oxoglutarate dehydrogenase complex dihydrolipoamide acyltransferase (E2) component
MRKAIVAPDIGVAAPLVSIWYARPGEWLYAGDRVVELLTGSATFDVAAPCTGRLIEKAAWPDDAVSAGQILGYIDEEDGEP